MTVILIFGLLIGLMMLGAPIAVSLALSSITVMVLTVGPDLLVIFGQQMYAPLTSFPLLAVPFFIVAGNLMNAGGMTHRIYDTAELIVGRIRGGYGHVNIVGSMIFSGMSGSAVADAAGLGVVEIEAAKRAGYSPQFAAALTGASATIGPIIPPSIPFIVYGSMTQVSIGSLFLAGVLPGLLMGVVLMAVVAVVAHRQQLPRGPARPPFVQALRQLAYAAPATIMPLIVLGGIITGWMTPTEAAVIATVYALLVGMLVYRHLTLPLVVDVFWESGKQTAQVLFIVAAAGAFGWVLVQQQIPNALIASTLSLGVEPWVVLLIVNILLLVLGMFLEALAIMIIVVPILAPLMASLGVDLVQFGVMMTLNLSIGLLTPPVGLVLYIVSGISGASVTAILEELWPYLLGLLFVLGLVTYIPAISLALPRALGF